MEEKIVKINISELKPHPENEKIYGADEDVSDLKKSILSEGLSVPLKITDKNIIISGHRRWKSCCQLVQEGHLEFSVVNCIVEHYQSTEDELKDIVIANAHRRKNYEQIAREALTLSEIHSAESEKRMMLGKRVDPTVNLPQGSTRDLTADDLKKAGVKISGTNVSNLIKAVQAIDSYDANGKSLEATLLKRELHKETPNYSSINKLTKNMDKFSDTEKQELLNNRTTISKLLKKHTPVKAKESKTSKNKITDEYNASMLFQDELRLTGIHLDVTKSKLEELKRLAEQNPVFSYYPAELINSLKSTISNLNEDFIYLQKVNSMFEIDLIKMLEPITRLDFWKNFSCFVTKKSSCYTLKDEIIFTILRSLALITDTYCWMWEEDGYYHWEYNVNEYLLNFAKKFNVLEDKEIIKNLIGLYEQFNKMITEMDDLTPKEWKFFNGCNIPHLINMLNYFNMLERPDISFKDILTDFLKSNEKEKYEEDEIDSEIYDVIYADENVEARTEILKDYVDDYIDRIDNESDDNE